MKKFFPNQPIMIWDGSCAFCKMCADRFNSYEPKKVELISFQNLHQKYPEAPNIDYSLSLALITKNGNMYRGASAVFRFFSEYPWKGFLHTAYNKFEFFASFSEKVYSLIASNRSILRQLVLIFWGKDFTKPTYKLSRWLFGRILGITIIIAFLSIWYQSDGLIGSGGISPYKDDLKFVLKSVESGSALQNKFELRPTILWLLPNSFGLELIFVIGTISGLLLIFGLIPPVATAFSWICYLSITVVSAPFLNFQWDQLLIETTLLSILYLPWVSKDKVSSLRNPQCIGKLIIWILLFKLIFQSGLVKLTFIGADGTNSWLNLSALKYHYWSQPIPNSFSWYFHWLPLWFNKFSTIVTLLIELVLPFLIFFPRNFKRIAFAGIVFLQLMIIFSGNYGFFNLLSIALCISLLDDSCFPKKIRKRILSSNLNQTEKSYLNIFKFILSLFFFFLSAMTTGFYINQSFNGNKAHFIKKSSNVENSIIRKIIEDYQFLRSMNSYGLFRVMTTKRPEIVLSISSDGETWEEVNFLYKPTDLKEKPKFIFPYMPRLDWQMWFESLYLEKLLDYPFLSLLYERFLEQVIIHENFVPVKDYTKLLTNKELDTISKMEEVEKIQTMKNIKQSIDSITNHSYWFANLIKLIAQNNEDVFYLLNHDLEKRDPSKYISIDLFYYKFSNKDEKADGFWWSRTHLKSFSMLIE